MKPILWGKSTHIGGQAVIEGVMMRDVSKYSVAVRLPSDEVETIVKDIKPWHKIFSKPFLRGIKALVENLKIGFSTLQWSAEKQEEKKVEEDQGKSNKNQSNKSNPIATFFTIFVAIAFAIGLFIVVPNVVVHLLGLVEKKTPLSYNLISGCVRLLIFFSYILLISLLKDVKRIFQYHGAEHKVIHAFEDGVDLKYENIKKYTTLHKRCGTSFIFLLIFVGILFFSLVPPLLGIIFSGFGNWSLIARKIVIISSHIVLLPFLASFSYEILKLSAKNNILGKSLVFLAYPGLFFQKITTREPDEKQVEVAVASLKVLLDKQD